MHNDRYYQKCTTFGRAREALHADFQEQLRELQREIGFEYVRFHGMFHDDMAVYDEDENGEPILWFGYIDKVFDFLLSVNLKPIVELSFMPIKIATIPNTIFWWQANGCPPTDYDKWGLLIRETVKHLTSRYGEEEVKTWYFEVWNEPNIYNFFRGTQEEYFEMYRVASKAVKSVCKAYRVGGPATAGSSDYKNGFAYLHAFIDFCSRENLPLDLITSHPYPTSRYVDIDGIRQMQYLDKDYNTRIMDAFRSLVDASPYPKAEIHLTEWSSSPSPRDLIHDTPFMAPYILYSVTHNFGKLDSLGFWTFTDVFEEKGPGKLPFHGGFGLMNVDGIKKPSYWAYWMLSKLGDEIVSVDDCSIVTRSGDNYQVIVYNYCHYTEKFAGGDHSELTATSRDTVFDHHVRMVNLELDLNKTYRQTCYTLDNKASALHRWLELGAPVYPTEKDIAWLKQTSRPAEQRSVVTSFSFHEQLASQEVRLFLLETLEAPSDKA